MNTELYNIVRTHKGSKTITHERVSKAFVESTLPNLKRRARDNHSGVYFDAVKIPADVLQATKQPHAQSATISATS